MLKALRLVLPLAFVATFSGNTFGQCAGCVSDVTCSVSPAFPTLCPLQPPDATAGEYYETDITFWLPPQFTDPGTGFNVSFQQMTITGVSGLPFGLGIQTNEPSGIYYPQQNEYGCARICGTPVGPGTFTVTISIIAGVEFSGIPINAPQQFAIVINVLPGSGGNSSFTYSPASGCGSISTTFQALIDASPQPTAWAWVFGNGNTSNSATPPAQTYDQPGEYVVTLETTISSFVLNSVTLTGVNGSWCGDIEEPFCNCGTPIIGTCPDLFFELINANGPVYASNTIDGVTSANWTGLNILLDNPPYSITFWDEDVISSNDNLGTYDITLTPGGNYAFNVAGGTAGSLGISLQVQQQFNDTDTVVVFANPEVVLAQSGNQLCVNEPDELIAFVWLLDGDTVPNAATPCFTPIGPGLWQVIGTNGFGCTSTSNTVVICPSIAITRNGPTLSASPGFDSYVWTYNGNTIPGANGPQITSIGDGTYTVTASGANDCTATAEFVLSTIGVEEGTQDELFLQVFPNPGDGLFTVNGTGMVGSTARLQLFDQTGRLLLTEQHAITQGAFQAALLIDAASGSYLLQVSDAQRSYVRRVVLR